MCQPMAAASAAISLPSCPAGSNGAGRCLPAGAEGYPSMQAKAILGCERRSKRRRPTVPGFNPRRHRERNRHDAKRKVAGALRTAASLANNTFDVKDGFDVNITASARRVVPEPNLAAEPDPNYRRHRRRARGTGAATDRAADR